MKVCTGIITFNPDIELLKNNLDSICHQVQQVVIVDNASDNFTLIQQMLMDYSSVIYIHNDENLGIATALNQVLVFAENNNFDWALTLDQDSISPSNLIFEFEKQTNEIGVAMICPQFEDTNDYLKKVTSKETVLYVDRCITSGSLLKVDVWRKIGGFDDKMFIDLVDYDLCYRLIRDNYKILQVNNVILKHAIGNIKIRSFLGKKIKIDNHSAFRKYFMTRNQIYFYKKYFPHCSLLRCFSSVFKPFLKMLIYESDKKNKIKSCCRGIIDGVLM